jgi:DnaK suppressor protein
MDKPLSVKRLEKLKGVLHHLREGEVNDIEKQLGRNLDIGMSRKIDVAMDTGDWASLDLAEGVDHKILEMRYRTYKEIADAFRRLEAGTYGICESCGKEIPLDRLTAEPFARHCVPCLTRLEALERVEKEIGKPSTL